MSTSYTTGPAVGLRLDDEVLGRPQPWTVRHRGLEYPGEVIVSEVVNADWGEPLEGETCFRVVCYTVPRRIPAGQIRDPRIAMIVPRRAADPAQQGLTREIHAIHEAKERYITGRDSDALSLRSSIEEREAALLRELARRDAIAYSQGRMYTQRGLSAPAPEIFVEPTAASWVDCLVRGILDQAYPDLPFNWHDLSGTLTAEEFELLYRGIFHDEPGASETVAEFGPALGLTDRDTPTVFEPTGCRVFEIIDEELGARAGETPASELLDLLCRGHGLNRALATLYLIAFVRTGRAEAELASDHSLELTQGGPFLSDRLSWDLVSQVRYTGNVGGQLGTVRTRPSLTWNAVLSYASLLVDGLDATRDPAEIAQQEARLLSALEKVGRGIESFRQRVEMLSTEDGEKLGPARAAIERLQLLCLASGYRGFHAAAVDSFGGPAGLSRALNVYQRLERLAALAPMLTRARRYLDEMRFGREHASLALLREQVLGRMGVNDLIANPSLWTDVEASYDRLRVEYGRVYLSHHARYHRDATDLLLRLGRLRPQVQALARFNEVADFGGPLGTDVSDRFTSLIASVRVCAASEAEVSLEDGPSCPHCQLPLDEEPPLREVSRLQSETERSMRVYNRRLSSEGVRRVLANPTREQLDQLIDLVHLGDLSALAGILDEDVVAFLLRFVRRT